MPDISASVSPALRESRLKRDATGNLPLSGTVGRASVLNSKIVSMCEGCFFWGARESWVWQLHALEIG